MKMHIDSLGSSGEGVGSLEGLKVFVEGALPSEAVYIQIVTKKRNYAVGKLLSIETASPHRIKPHCPIFNDCGGCQLMHLAYGEQLNAKRLKIINALQRIGHLEDFHVDEVMPSPHELRYRNKISFPVLYDKNGLKVGLYRKQSHDIIPFKGCDIHCELGEKVAKQIIQQLPFIPNLKENLRHILIKTAVHTQQSLVIFITRKKTPHLQLLLSKLQLPEVVGFLENINPSPFNSVLGNQFILHSGKDYLIEEIDNFSFKISAPSFFQVNVDQAAQLFRHAVSLADISSQDLVVDAYCGVGTLALFASKWAKHVIGIEYVSSAIEDAKANAILNRITNCEFFVGKSENLLQKWKKIDRLFLNPPRKGCEAELLTHVKKCLPKKIIYISCDPASLARDLSQLNTHYQVRKISPFDMFPQTMHVETVVLLEVREKAN